MATQPKAKATAKTKSKSKAPTKPSRAAAAPEAAAERIAAACERIAAAAEQLVQLMQAQAGPATPPPAADEAAEVEKFKKSVQKRVRGAADAAKL